MHLNLADFTLTMEVTGCWVWRSSGSQSKVMIWLVPDGIFSFLFPRSQSYLLCFIFYQILSCSKVSHSPILLLLPERYDNNEFSHWENNCSVHKMLIYVRIWTCYLESTRSDFSFLRSLLNFNFFFFITQRRCPWYASLMIWRTNTIVKIHTKSSLKLLIEKIPIQVLN